MTKNPLVSVVMPLYNCERFVRRAVYSILDQTVRDFEFLVIDDGSTDKGPDIVRSIKDDRIMLIELGEHCDISTALNTGVQRARGKYIARMDADDYCLADRFEKQLNFLQDNPDVVAVGCQVKFFSRSGKFLFQARSPLSHAEICADAPESVHFLHATAMFRADVMRKTPYREALNGAEDADFRLRLAESGNLANLGEYLYWITVRPEQTTLSQSLRQTVLSKACAQLARERQSLGADGLEIYGESYVQELCRKYLKENGAALRRQIARSFVQLSEALQCVGEFADARSVAWAAVRHNPKSDKTWRRIVSCCYRELRRKLHCGLGVSRLWRSGYDIA